MAEEKIVLLSDDPSFISRVGICLEKIPVQLSVMDVIPTPESMDSGTLIICDLDLTVKNLTILPWIATNNKKLIFAYSPKQGKSPILVMNEIDAASHVICKSEPFKTGELTTIVSNVLKKKPPAIEDFLEKKAHIERMEISDYALKDPILNHVREIASGLSAFHGIGDNAVTVVWEFMMNAIFDASDALMSLFEGERTEDILISDEDSIKISIGFDTQRLVISIRDNFGTVEKPSVLKALMRCELMGIDQGSSNPSGAGIGLYMAFKSLNQLNFVIEKNVATEVVGVIYLTKRLKIFAERSKSVSFFMNTTAMG